MRFSLGGRTGRTLLAVPLSSYPEFRHTVQVSFGPVRGRVGRASHTAREPAGEPGAREASPERAAWDDRPAPSAGGADPASEERELAEPLVTADGEPDCGFAAEESEDGDTGGDEPEDDEPEDEVPEDEVPEDGGATPGLSPRDDCDDGGFDEGSSEDGSSDFGPSDFGSSEDVPEEGGGQPGGRSAGGESHAREVPGPRLVDVLGIPGVLTVMVGVSLGGGRVGRSCWGLSPGRRANQWWPCPGS